MSTSKQIIIAQLVLFCLCVATVATDWSRRFLAPPPNSQAKENACFLRLAKDKLCITSFERLFSSRSTADGKTIVLVGYLGIRNGIPTLFPNKNDYLHDVVVNSLALQGSAKTLSLLDGHWYSYVMVEGQFKKSTDEGQSPWLGELRPMISVHGADEAAKEDVDEIAINVDYIEQ